MERHDVALVSRRRRRPGARAVARRPAAGPRAARARRPAQRRRPLPLLAPRGDRRRPRRAPPPVPRRRRELAARPQHRRGRAQRERVPGRRGPHRRRAPLEPPRRDGHRPLPARPPPPDARGASPRWAAGATLPVLGVDNLPGSVAIDAYALPERCVLLFGQEGPGLSDEARELSRGGARDPPVRLHPLDQRGGGERGRDARMGAPLGAGGVASAHAPARPPLSRRRPDARLDRPARAVPGALPRPLRRRLHAADRATRARG